MLLLVVAATGCSAYSPSAREDTNDDGHVTFHDDDPTAHRGFERHMDRQNRNYTERDASDD